MSFHQKTGFKSIKAVISTIAARCLTFRRSNCDNWDDKGGKKVAQIWEICGPATLRHAA